MSAPTTAIERLAALAVEFGANVQKGQIVSVVSEFGKEELTRAVVARAYKRGAKFVDVVYVDPWIRRARIELAADESLDFIPPWYRERMLQLGVERCADIQLSGPAQPGLLDDLDAARIGRTIWGAIPERLRVVNERTINWTIVPAPTVPWAQLVHPGVAAEQALAMLWEDVVHICRLDEPDPVEAWQRRARATAAAAAALNERHFDAIQLEGPGTDLTIGLFPSSQWHGAESETVDGIPHFANLPTEEVYTAPDPERVDGIVSATRPVLMRDRAVEGLVIRFENGRAVDITAAAGEGTIRALAEQDDGAGRLGEVALVDRDGRVGSLGRVFYDTLIDENAASHVALGAALDYTVGESDRDRLNRSEIHLDFMVGGPEVAVTGITRDGERVPVLRQDIWQL